MARLFAQEGARVVIADVKEAEGEALAHEIGEPALFLPLDVSREADWRIAMQKTQDRFGGLDILVNNAALLHIAALDETRREDFLRLVEVNQLGPFLGTQAALDPMKNRGGGSIINIASTDGLKGMNGVSAYASTKWAVRGLTRSTAIELGHHRIRVNAICPEAGNPNMSAPFFPGTTAPDSRSKLLPTGRTCRRHLMPPAVWNIDISTVTGLTSSRSSTMAKDRFALATPTG